MKTFGKINLSVKTYLNAFELHAISESNETKVF